MFTLIMEGKRRSSDALRWAHNEFTKNDPEGELLLAEYRIRICMGQQVYDLRNATGMTQGQLANLLGLDVSAIDKLEQADHEGYFVVMREDRGSAAKKG